MKIMIVTDAWNQTNGVVTTLKETKKQLEIMGHEVFIIHPEMFPNKPLPFYPEIKVPLTLKGFAHLFKFFDPDAVHIAVEGRLGIVARNYCKRHKLPFTTAYHTDFPRYLNSHFKVPLSWTWRYIRWFHRASSAVMVSTKSIADELRAHGIGNLAEWTRGVSTCQFIPAAFDRGPIKKALYVGRLSKEKNIEAFLALDLPFPHEKIIVGDGPHTAALKAIAGREVRFLGKLKGKALASAYQQADVFVFPSRTDTFGLVMIEAMACGTPVAAYPVSGPIDVVGKGGALDDDLGTAVQRALMINRNLAVIQAAKFTWKRATEQFVTALRIISR